MKHSIESGYAKQKKTKEQKKIIKKLQNKIIKKLRKLTFFSKTTTDATSTSTSTSKTSVLHR
jgi:hypothetical protein